MFCNHCGAPNHDDAGFCARCGASLVKPSDAASLTSQTNVPAPVPPYPIVPPPPGTYPEINSYLAPAILVTLFCCLPLGIPAIVFAAQVNSKLAAGDINGALASSKNAKMWTWISFGVGIGGVLIYAVIILASLAAGRFPNR